MLWTLYKGVNMSAIILGLVFIIMVWGESWYILRIRAKLSRFELENLELRRQLNVKNGWENDNTK